MKISKQVVDNGLMKNKKTDLLMALQVDETCSEVTQEVVQHKEKNKFLRKQCTSTGRFRGSEEDHGRKMRRHL